MSFKQIAERDPDDTVASLHAAKDGKTQEELAKQNRNAAEEASAALQLLMTALGALSKRTLIALSSLFTMLTVGSAFALWFSTPNPDTYQLVSLGMYAVFVLAINYIARK